MRSSVEVDRQVRHAQDRLVDADELLGAVTEHDPSGHAEVAVEPGVEQRAAVGLERDDRGRVGRSTSWCCLSRRLGLSVWPPTTRNRSVGCGRGLVGPGDERPARTT